MQQQPLTRKDFVSDQEVRWCPGCGDYNILAQVQKVMPELGVPRENIVFISGIGCSSRFPYYMNTFGFHTIHGRAPAVATGLKVARPDLSVWVVTGDGDGLSIGGNHLLHALRRNIDLKIILFNNRIYGLTKGQYSPTSELGKKTKSSPDGSVESPIDPISIALASEATFVARSYDTDLKHLGQILATAAAHKGSCFIEVYQNCVVFNDAAFAPFTDKKVRPDTLLYLEDGQPMIYGTSRDKGIVMEGFHPKVVNLTEGKYSEGDVLKHDSKLPEPGLAYILAGMRFPHFPVPVGIFRQIERQTYEERLEDQVQNAINKRGPGKIENLFREGETWTAS